MRMIEQMIREVRFVVSEEEKNERVVVVVVVVVVVGGDVGVGYYEIWK